MRFVAEDVKKNGRRAPINDAVRREARAVVNAIETGSPGNVVAAEIRTLVGLSR